MTPNVRGYHWVMLSFSFIIAFLLHLLLFSTAPMVTLIMEEMGLSHASFGFIFSIAMVSLVLFRIPWGLISDRIGYLNSLRIALPVSSVSAILRAFSPNYLTFLLSQFFLGLGLAVVLPCLPLLIREWSNSKLGLSTGLYISGFAVGNATALGLTPHLLRLMLWREVLLIYSSLITIVSIFWWVLAKSNMKNTSNMKVTNIIGILKDKYVWVLLFFMIASMGSYDTLATWIPKVLEMKELNTALASTLPLGFFFAGPIMGFSLDKIKKKKSLIALLGIISFVSILGINYTSLPFLLICIFLSGFASIGVLTISLTAPVEHTRLSTSAGSVTGIISSLGNIGPLIMPVVFGFLIDVTDTFYFSILSVALLAGVTFILGSRLSEG